MNMQLSDFHFDLPKHLIAQQPTSERTASRLLYLHKQTAAIEHRQFIDLPTLLRPGDLLIFNDTKVIPARLYGHKTTGGRIELLIERVIAERQALVHVRASKSLKQGERFFINEHITGDVLGKNNGLFDCLFHGGGSVYEIMSQYGQIPLPPYIKRPVTAQDSERYQTVYAQHTGAIAAPTAGLHFDTNSLEQLDQAQVERAYVTLHVGSGTFQPVRVADIRQHTMHTEMAHISTAVCDQIKATKQRGGRVIAVGTTVVRSLETAARSGQLHPFSGETDIFIYPGYPFRVIDGLITNFHLPESTLLMLVAALAGYQPIKTAYQAAVEQEYRFFSYGDAMLIA